MEYMTLAQAVGEAPMSPLCFIPGEDFNPYDEDDREAVKLAMERDMADRIRHLQRENAQLRAQLENREDDYYDEDDYYYDEDES